jgi:hypothetical protein
VEQINNALRKTELDARASRTDTDTAGAEPESGGGDIEAEEADEGTGIDPETAEIDAILDGFLGPHIDPILTLGEGIHRGDMHRNEGPGMARKAEKAGIVEVNAIKSHTHSHIHTHTYTLTHTLTLTHTHTGECF